MLYIFVKSYLDKYNTLAINLGSTPLALHISPKIALRTLYVIN